jgi:allophanate hydrolase
MSDTSPADRVKQAYERIHEVDRPEIWIGLRSFEEVAAEAEAVDPRLPLAGTLFAVKNNIDVAGLPTTAGCPSYGHLPERDATAVARLRAVGAVPLGTTNLDQFATGLVGTRSPYGAVRGAFDPTRISGGSSSGSAVAVALGIVDFALGTDTAGSGRVPAALNRIVGIKPTYGLVPTDGVVPACRSLDCVTVFAPSLPAARRALSFMASEAAAPPARRPGPWRVAVPATADLGELAPGWADQFEDAARSIAYAGADLRPIDIGPFLEAATLLYRGAFVAERYAAVGAFVDKDSPDLDPTVASIIRAAGTIPAHRLLDDQHRLETLRTAAFAALADADALLLPTAPRHPALSEVAADPIGVNTDLGRFTNSTNLFGMCAIAIPGGAELGVMLLGRPHSDDILAAIAEHLAPRPHLKLAVVGAHLTGQPLNHQLTSRGGRLLETTTTSATYRLHALPTEPPKPGLVRVAQNGAPIEVEIWELAADALGTLLPEIPRPLALGDLELQSGENVTGFLCTPEGLHGSSDITHHGGWRSYLTATRSGPARNHAG